MVIVFKINLAVPKRITQLKNVKRLPLNISVINISYNANTISRRCFILPEIEDLLKDVEILREKLLYLIHKKQGNLIDEEVVRMSKVLDATLNEYNKVLSEKLKK